MDTIVLTGSPQLRTALKLALRIQQQITATSENLHIAGENGGTKERAPALFREIVKGVIFSRQFILTYHAVIACFLLTFTIRHWGGKWRRWQKKRARRQNTGYEEIASHTSKNKELPVVEHAHSGSSSSSSSTLEGTISPKSGKNEALLNEQSPLLGELQEPSSRSDLQRLWNKIQGWLIYQPRPIPVINKTLPSNGQSLAVIVLFAVNMFYLFYNITFSIPLMFVFADRASLIFAANLPLLYLLAAKNQPIKFLTGYSYESLNIFHRRLGEILCFAALLHGLGMVVVWYTLLRPAGMTFIHFILLRVILLGILALIAYETIYFTSLGSFRQRWYELFLALHVTLQVAALLLLFFHHHGSRIYVGIALTIFAIDRLVYRLTLKSIIADATLEIYDDQKTVGLHVPIPLISPDDRSFISSLAPTTLLNGWHPAQHIYLTTLSLSFPLYTFQAHPFTIASLAPNRDSEDPNGPIFADLDLIMRVPSSSRTGFCTSLLAHARLNHTTKVRLDGPYGSPSAVDLLQSADLSVIIAGGSGIAVAWPLLKSTIHHYFSCPAEYREATAKYGICPPHSSKRQRILCIWVTRHHQHRTWLGRYPNRPLSPLIFFPEVYFDIKFTNGHAGRPDLKVLIEEWVQDQLALRSAKQEGKRVAVVCAGPDGMNRVVRNTTAGLRGRGVDVGVEIEKFGW